MTFYSDLAADALATLTEFGGEVTLRSVAAGAYDPATGTASLTPTDTTRIGALFDVASGKTTIRGSLVQTGDKQLLLDATGPVALQDRFVVGSSEYSIVSIGEIQPDPAGVIVVYDLHLRK